MFRCLKIEFLLKINSICGENNFLQTFALVFHNINQLCLKISRVYKLDEIHIGIVCSADCRGKGTITLTVFNSDISTV